MKITMIPRDTTVNISHKSFEVNPKSLSFIKQVESEVKKLQVIAKLDPNFRNRIMQTCKIINRTAYAGGITTLLLSHQEQVLSFLNPTGSVIPQDLIDFIIAAIIIIALIGVGGGIICLMLAGFLKMVNSKKADAWTENVVKGVVQVFAAAPIIGLITLMFCLLFSHFPVFHPVLEGIKTFFKNLA